MFREAGAGLSLPAPCWSRSSPRASSSASASSTSTSSGSSARTMSCPPVIWRTVSLIDHRLYSISLDWCSLPLNQLRLHPVPGGFLQVQPRCRRGLVSLQYFRRKSTRLTGVVGGLVMALAILFASFANEVHQVVIR